MFDWVRFLGELPTIVAALVVFACCLILVLKYLTKNVVDPFKVLVSNHMAHLSEDQRADREERAKMRESIDRQTVAIQSQADAFHRVCDKIERDSP